MSKSSNFRLDDDTLARLDAIAADTGTNRTEAVRLAVAAYGVTLVERTAADPAEASPGGDDHAAAVGRLRAENDALRAGMVKQNSGFVAEMEDMQREINGLRAELERARAATLAAMQRDHGTRTRATLSLPPVRALPGPVIPDTPRVHRLANPVMVARMARQRDLGSQD